jgi:hypothetical protein
MLTMSESTNPLGDLLRDARTRLPGRRGALSVADAAARAGVSAQTWRNYENGWQAVAGIGRVPLAYAPATIIRMAHAVDVDVSTALAAAGIDPDTVRTSEITDSQWVGALQALEDWAGDEPDRRQVVHRLRSVMPI